MKFFLLILILATNLHASIADLSREDLLKAFFETPSTEEQWIYGAEIMTRKNGVLDITDVLDKSLKLHGLTNYARTRCCVDLIRQAAIQNKIPSEKKDRLGIIKTLLKAVDKMHLPSTVLAAQALKIITNVDPGYTENFINEYTEKDEARRQKMIDQWRKWMQDESKAIDRTVPLPKKMSDRNGS